jgi:oxygen-independent coproporphyrinogen-3 oxidase
MTGYSIYVHLPFCLSKCPYCDFFSTAMKPVPFVEYREALLIEWEHRRRLVDDLELVSVYLGGGTPSLWTGSELRTLLDALGAAGSREVTVEVNPGDAREDWFAILKEAGVSRFSIGVQAVDDKRLKQLGRRHDRHQAERAIMMAKRSGVASVGADLIYGTPDQDAQSLTKELQALVSLDIQHLSAYELTIAPNTPFGRLARQGAFRGLGDEKMAELWHVVGDTLLACGFHRYEVSNYAKPGHQSLHNRHTWQGRSYIGLGAGAYGFVVHDGGIKSRYANGETIAGYLEALNGPLVLPRYHGIGTGAFVEQLSMLTYARERIMLGFRTEEGVLFSRVVDGLSPSLKAQWSALVKELEHAQMVRCESGWIRPTVQGMLYADGLAERFFG